MMSYIEDDSLYAEQFNTLLLVNEIVKREKLDYTPVFELLGGTALLLHGVKSVFTVDIDCANKMTENVSNLVEGFISDMASEVVTLPRLYQTRLRVFEQDRFDSIAILLLSMEDLIVTKLVAFRSKDKEDLIATSILDDCNIALVKSIIEKEVPKNMVQKLTNNLSHCLSERELFKCREEKTY